MNNAPVTNRLDYIDICKGIGILSVVIGHIYYRGIVNNIIYLYHMPLFFFVSGYLFKVQNDQKKFISNKFKQLMLPYFIYLLIIYSLQKYLEFKSTPVTSMAILHSVVYAILGGRWLGGFTSVFWFIPCLFFSLVFMNFILNSFQRRTVIIIVIVCYILSYCNEFWFETIRFPYDINVVLGIVPFFYLGFISKSLASNKILIVAALLSALGIVLIFRGIDDYYDIKNSLYGIPVISFLASVSVIHLIVFLSKKIAFISGVFIQLGNASLVIMYLHQPIQLLTKMYISDNVYLRMAIATLLSYLFYLLFNKGTWTRALFLGSINDQKDLKKRVKSLKFSLS